MQLQKIIPVKLGSNLCLLALSLTATTKPLMAKTPAINPTQGSACESSGAAGRGEAFSVAPGGCLRTDDKACGRPAGFIVLENGGTRREPRLNCLDFLKLTQVQTESQGYNKPSNFPKSLSDTKIEHQMLKASRLYEGMTEAEVEQVMGKPTDTKVFPNLDVQIEIQNYRQEPILTKVSMIDGHLSGITTELKTVTNNNIPHFAQGIQVGMNRQDVLKLMGKPFSERRNDISMYKFEQLVYVKDSEPAVNVILTDDRVEGINTGLETPPRILKVILPAEPLIPTRGPANQRIRIGMNPQQVLSIYGQPTFVETTEFKQQKVVDFVYATLNTDASTRFTFIDNVLTRFSFVPQSNFFRNK